MDQQLFAKALQGFSNKRNEVLCDDEMTAAQQRQGSAVSLLLLAVTPTTVHARVQWMVGLVCNTKYNSARQQQQTSHGIGNESVQEWSVTLTLFL